MVVPGCIREIYIHERYKLPTELYSHYSLLENEQTVHRNHSSDFSNVSILSTALVTQSHSCLVSWPNVGYFFALKAVFELLHNLPNAHHPEIMSLFKVS